MKANVPEKIYLTSDEKNSYVFTQKRSDNKGVEYIRKDVFVEKILDFFENDLCCYIKAQEYTIEHGRLEEDFKKYMEE